MSISEDNFQAIVVELARNTKSYEDKKIKHYQWADVIDSIFANYGVVKQEFFRELNSRCGVQTNDTREKKRKPIVKKTKRAVKI